MRKQLVLELDMLRNQLLSKHGMDSHVFRNNFNTGGINMHDKYL